MADTQTLEAQVFIDRVLSLPDDPGTPLDPTLQTSLDDEAELRRLFAQDRTNVRLQNPYVGLVDVSCAPDRIQTTRARIVNDDLDAQYVMPLSETVRRPDGTPSMASDLDEFKRNWSIFSEGSLSQLLNWDNVLAAGGSVLACLAPLPETARKSKRTIRKYYHSVAYPTSDVDLFLWGLTPAEAEKKIIEICDAVRDSVPWDITCIRTKHTISIHSQYPCRPVQIVLRLYSSPAELLAGFDVDAPCCGYDGTRVYATPRSIIAMMRQCNTVDVTRRSPSYEVRLAKYASRGFEVSVPGLLRADIDPTIFERSVARVTGLARLLVLEKLKTTDNRLWFLETRRKLRGRPEAMERYDRHARRVRKAKRGKGKSDLKANQAVSAERNDYDVTSLHIPYGPGWDIQMIEKLVYETDLGMNSTYNPKNKGRRLHRHPAFFGTIEECLEDCCEHCPSPIDEDERNLQTREDKDYIRGRITFVEDDPGRQILSGSFNPIDDEEWTAQAYIGPTHRFFSCIAAADRPGVARILAEGHDIHRRDHVGRTALHFAIMCRSAEIACDLIDAGARLTARLVDGRTSLHLAAQHDLLPVVRAILRRSALNAEFDPRSESPDDEMDVEPAPDSSEDDWSSDEDMNVISEEDEPAPNGLNPTKATTPVDEEDGLPVDDTSEPDVLDINHTDWDLSFTALGYVIVYASLPVVELLLTAGADVKLISQPTDSLRAALPLTLTTLRADNFEEDTCKIAERLILAGASCSAADERTSCTIFHRAVAANRPNLVAEFLRCDPNGQGALNHLMFSSSGLLSPLITSISMGHYSVTAVLLAHGASHIPSEGEVQQTLARDHDSRFGSLRHRRPPYSYPVEVALCRHDDIARLLVNLRIGIDIPRRVESGQDVNQNLSQRLATETVIGWVRTVTTELKPDWPWKETLFGTGKESPREDRRSQIEQAASRSRLADIEKYWIDTEEVLLRLYVNPPRPYLKQTPWERAGFVVDEDEDEAADGGNGNRNSPLSIRPRPASPHPTVPAAAPIEARYHRLKPHLRQEEVPAIIASLYDELFDACFNGENSKIEALCLAGQDPSSRTAPLQISVSLSRKGASEYDVSGITPLFAALVGRRWETAHLVVAIAAAQYKPDEDSATERIDDASNDGSEMSDITVEQTAMKFIDISSHPAQFQCDIHPGRLLCPDNTDRNPAVVSIRDNDFEAFVNILALYARSPIPIPFHSFRSNILDHLIENDRVDMLDEYIRTTGVGLKPPPSTLTSDTPVTFVNDKSKLYLGLTVHGKKRMGDTDRQVDPKAAQEWDWKRAVPIVWQAALKGATRILEYLCGERPLAAYRLYASSHSTYLATRLKRPDLSEVLPEWLGWSILPSGESPLTAAVMSRRLDVVQYLFKKAPRLMASSLHRSLKFSGVNLLMLAIRLDCDLPLVRFLLAKGVSPAEADRTRGWNIFHYICSHGRYNLLKGVLSDLPRELVVALLDKQSKPHLDTPLHLCAKRGFVNIVQLIAEVSESPISIRDVDGFTPLHCATKAGFKRTVKILIDAEPRSLSVENGVGETPFEMAALRALTERQELFGHQVQWPEISKPYWDPPAWQSSLKVPDKPPRLRLDELAEELPRLRATLNSLLQRGVIPTGGRMATEMLVFVEYMEAMVTEKESTPKDHSAEYSAQESANSAATFEEIRLSMETVNSAGNREIVRLVDVQTSVHHSFSWRPEPGQPPFYLPLSSMRENKAEDTCEHDEDAQGVCRSCSRADCGAFVLSDLYEWGNSDE
ncbi:ankyrin repeat protein [Mycena filopes]|nr:ankyrin repeat protein [Mycena filopes]